MTFYIQMVKGQLHCDIIMFCKKTLSTKIILFNVVTQEGEIVTLFSATWLVGGGINPQGGNSSFYRNKKCSQ